VITDLLRPFLEGGSHKRSCRNIRKYNLYKSSALARGCWRFPCPKYAPMNSTNKSLGEGLLSAQGGLYTVDVLSRTRPARVNCLRDALPAARVCPPCAAMTGVRNGWKNKHWRAEAVYSDDK